MLNPTSATLFLIFALANLTPSLAAAVPCSTYQQSIMNLHQNQHTTYPSRPTSSAKVAVTEKDVVSTTTSTRFRTMVATNHSTYTSPTRTASKHTSFSHTSPAKSTKTQTHLSNHISFHASRGAVRRAQKFGDRSKMTRHALSLTEGVAVSSAILASSLTARSKIARAFRSSTTLVVEPIQTSQAKDTSTPTQLYSTTGTVGPKLARSFGTSTGLGVDSTTTPVAAKITRGPRNRKYNTSQSIEVGSKSKGANPRKDGFKTVRVRGSCDVDLVG
ncbi:hypothetical protein GLAREA_04889 [Glarea lozoyensis ATCC 20868]|uniref:Uncharacterized protein n=1 Tax=Glarea lozoyensis (strain ATCC 20868 / MF5171) TaxID=1116229 RepID=S3DNP3_GLAL2|nr:uncharacterized protein GLAREA_04889 [Glarea lozoyensis ATCC 20868]EPE28098.1 hypothetical protein GLAREA_04889 [Glarea lozoyensis ATCC 20868]